MATNILALPRLRVACETRSNEDWRDGIAFRDQDEAPISLVGITFIMHLRDAPSQVRIFLEASTENGRLVTGGADGTFGFLVAEVDMSQLPAGSYDFDVVAQADGVERTLIVGTLDHELGVTRS